MNHYEIQYLFPYLVPKPIRDMDKDLEGSIAAEIGMHPRKGAHINLPENQVPIAAHALLSELAHRNIAATRQWVQFYRDMYWRIRAIRRLLKLDDPYTKDHHDHLVKWLTDCRNALNSVPADLGERLPVFPDYRDVAFRTYAETWYHAAGRDIQLTILLNELFKLSFKTSHFHDRHAMWHGAYRLALNYPAMRTEYTALSTDHLHNWATVHRVRPIQVTESGSVT